jgi:hypothetical protein
MTNPIVNDMITVPLMGILGGFAGVTQGASCGLSIEQSQYCGKIWAIYGIAISSVEAMGRRYLQQKQSEIVSLCCFTIAHTWLVIEMSKLALNGTENRNNYTLLVTAASVAFVGFFYAFTRTAHILRT